MAWHQLASSDGSFLTDFFLVVAFGLACEALALNWNLPGSGAIATFTQLNQG